MRAHRFAALLLLALAPAACAHTSPQSAEKAAPSPGVLRVDNQSVYDMEIFMDRQTGERVRVGSVGSRQTADLTIPPGLIVPPSTVYFLWRPLPGQRAGLAPSTNSTGQSLAVTAGDTVRMTIPR